AAYAHAGVDLARGDAAGALPYARKAVLQWGGVGCPFEVARARVVLARACAAMEDVRTAAGELAAARRTFGELGAAPDDAAAAALEETLPTTPPPGAGVQDGLTSRELEVLALVVAGRSNRQIARALVISDRTVARHLSNIFTKIDVGSRTEAAAYAFRHGLAPP
ncbi:MAG TPA: response regulator transcription factor, partial [Candidatus Brachybacterium intestinipullorum]|nr:response regulator transcription factor [Candidatus Brachybacterium intestinipullorum]